MSRYLFTTLREKKLSNSFFLFDESRLNKKKYYVPKYHWNSLSKKKKDYIYLSKLYKRLLFSLHKHLNKIHKKKYSINYWRIILGPWLNFYISSSFDRYSILDDFFKKKKKINYISYNIEKSLNNNFYEYLNNIHNSDLQNYLIFDKMIKFLFKKKIEVIQKPFKHSIYKKEYNYYDNFFISYFKKLFFISSSYFKKNIFLSTNLSKKTLPKLYSLFGSYCNFFLFYNFYECFLIKKSNVDLRSRLLSIKTFNNFEKYIQSNIMQDIPSSYLEMFIKINETIKKSSMHKQKIISSVEYITDDFYKIWMAEKKLNGSEIYIYDHSNSLRCSFFDFNHEFEISKKIITNLRTKDKNFKNLPELKFSINSEKIEIKNTNNISIILYEGPKYAGRCISAPQSHTTIHQINQILNFYNRLNNKTKKMIKFKTPPNSKERFNTNLKLRSLFPSNKVYKRNKKLSKVIENSRLLICTYPQTTFLEILMSGKPFIILMPREHWLFDAFGEKIIKRLTKINVLFDNEVEAAKQINKISNNIESWWKSKNKEIIKIKKIFFNFQFKENSSWKKFFLK